MGDSTVEAVALIPLFQFERVLNQGNILLHYALISSCNSNIPQIKLVAGLCFTGASLRNLPSYYSKEHHSLLRQITYQLFQPRWQI